PFEELSEQVACLPTNKAMQSVGKGQADDPASHEFFEIARIGPPTELLGGHEGFGGRHRIIPHLGRGIRTRIDATSATNLEAAVSADRIGWPSSDSSTTGRFRPLADKTKSGHTGLDQN